MNDTWIKLHRKFIQSPIWKYAVDAKMPHLVSLWCFILLSANWEDKKWYDGKEEITIPKGSLITSISHLSNGVAITYQQTRTALKHFENMKMITHKTTSKWSQIWIVNWSKYQMTDNSNNKHDNKPITNQQQTDNKPITTTKEDKNIRNKEYKEREEKIPLSYLTNIPENDIEEFSTTYKCSKTQVVDKGEDLYNYCKAKNKKYTDHKAMLRNALRKDFGKRTIEVVAQVVPDEISEEQREKNRQRIAEMKAELKIKTMGKPMTDAEVNDRQNYLREQGRTV